jgi:hypothetical protein
MWNQNRDNPGLDRAVGAWLRAEAAATEAEAPAAAEAALGRVFRRLPLPAVDLAPGVFARLGLALPGRRLDLFASWKLRLVVGAALVLSASALALLPWLWPAAKLVGSPGTFGQLLAGALVVGARWLASGMDLWRVLGSLGGALARFAAHPPVAATLLVAAMVAAGAFGTLNRLITSERSFS